MSSLKQIEANRANARKSTGPITKDGKQRSRCNAVRHGLTAETVIGALENADDYRSFEGAITADYDAQSAVERELVLRLASVLWRLRRATAMETGLFEIEADPLSRFSESGDPSTTSPQIVSALLGTKVEKTALTCFPSNQALFDPRKPLLSNRGKTAESSLNPATELARRFLCLANIPNFALDRLSRYEVALWRQVGQLLFALDALDRRKPQERKRLFAAHPWNASLPSSE